MDIDHSGYGLGFRHLERSYLILLNLDRVLLANLRGVAVVGDRTAPLLRSLSRRDGLFPPHGHAVGAALCLGVAFAFCLVVVPHPQYPICYIT
jgi:hypothetical protein